MKTDSFEEKGLLIANDWHVHINGKKYPKVFFPTLEF